MGTALPSACVEQPNSLEVHVTHRATGLGQQNSLSDLRAVHALAFDLRWELSAQPAVGGTVAGVPPVTVEVVHTDAVERATCAFHSALVSYGEGRNRTLADGRQVPMHWGIVEVTCARLDGLVAIDAGVHNVLKVKFRLVPVPESGAMFAPHALFQVSLRTAGKVTTPGFAYAASDPISLVLAPAEALPPSGGGSACAAWWTSLTSLAALPPSHLLPYLGALWNQSRTALPCAAPQCANQPTLMRSPQEFGLLDLCAATRSVVEIWLVQVSVALTTPDTQQSPTWSP